MLDHFRNFKNIKMFIIEIDKKKNNLIYDFRSHLNFSLKNTNDYERSNMDDSLIILFQYYHKNKLFGLIFFLKNVHKKPPK